MLRVKKAHRSIRSSVEESMVVVLEVIVVACSALEDLRMMKGPPANLEAWGGTENGKAHYSSWRAVEEW